MKSPARHVCLLYGALPLMASVVLAQQQSVLNTVHNLSSSGPGEIRSLSESEVCKFCHIPHNTQAPEALWSQSLSQAEYVTPDVTGGTAFTAQAPQPDGSSRLCLSCHDGTVAMGEAGSAASPGSSGRLGPGRPGFLGTDLSGSHPVSFVVPDIDPGLSSRQDIGLKSLPQIQADDQVMLDEQGKMQCTTCHDPHTDLYYQPDRVPRFWVKPTLEGVCLTCHELR